MGDEYAGTDDDGGFGAALSAIAAGRQQAQLARLFGLLAAGERLARRAALLQSRLAPTGREARFFRSQARQEHLHALVFELAQRQLAAAPGAMDDLFESFWQRVHRAATAGAYHESIVAIQVILEHVGERLLRSLDAGIERRGAGLRRLRKLFLAQECAHHAFGQRMLHDAIVGGRCDPHWLVRRAEPYLAQVPQWFGRERALTEDFGFDSVSLVDAIGNELAMLERPRRS